VKGGGRTVKNVSGYDVARLMVGSFGTLGTIVQATLRCEPRPMAAAWIECPFPGSEVLRRAFRPAAVLTDGARSTVLVEGYPADVEAECARLGADAGAAAPALPAGPHRGRISVRPGTLDALVAALDALAVSWLAEAGVGTVHVASADATAVAAARAVAHAHGGWMLRESGAPALDGFGRASQPPSTLPENATPDAFR
jgi:FAD/FMN-containing dehydrogenase